MKISNRNPVPFYHPNPIGYDKACQSIQTLLANVSWIEKSFGRAWDLASEATDSNRRPFAFLGGGEYYELLPNDSLKSYSFLIPINDEEIEDYSASAGSSISKRRTALILWGNLNKIDKTISDLESLKLDIKKAFKKSLAITNLTTVKDQYMNDIFRPYDIKGKKRELYFPFFAMRFEFDLSFVQEYC